jgi:predicted neutral ceramidase superfamily lipid hydrolase
MVRQRSLTSWVRFSLASTHAVSWGTLILMGFHMISSTCSAAPRYCLVAIKRIITCIGVHSQYSLVQSVPTKSASELVLLFMIQIRAFQLLLKPVGRRFHMRATFFSTYHMSIFCLLLKLPPYRLFDATPTKLA